MQDTFEKCKRCESDLCYRQQIDEKVSTWLCLSCGFTTNTYLTEGSEAVNRIYETSPELYKDLLYKDDENKIWAPSTITLPDKGMVFIDGTSVDNWVWKAVKAIPITNEDRQKKNYPEGQEYRMDMENGKAFNQNNFSLALDQIEFYK